MTGDGKMCVLFYIKPFLNFYKGFFGIVVDIRMLCLLPEWLVTFVKKMHETFTLLCFPAVCFRCQIGAKALSVYLNNKLLGGGSS